MIHKIRANLMALITYKKIQEGEPFLWVRCLLDHLAMGSGEASLEAYTKLCQALQEEGFEDLGAWTTHQLKYLDTPFAQNVANQNATMAEIEQARREVKFLNKLVNLDREQVIHWMVGALDAPFHTVCHRLPSWQGALTCSFEALIEGYQKEGGGVFAQYKAFFWTWDALVPIAEPDCPIIENLRGFQRQRDQVIANTRAFVKGYPVNDVLLYGNSGTGKSATIKALLTLPECENLRLIEIQKTGLAELSALIRMLKNRPQFFILFIDDLAFDEDDLTYSLVKSILEGGLEPRPKNVAIYATSNRRLLVRQTFSARAGDEVDMRETIEEKSALAERFGLRISYEELSKKEFLNLIEELAPAYEIPYTKEEWMTLAVQWDIRYPGRTPRGAKHFLASLVCDNDVIKE